MIFSRRVRIWKRKKNLKKNFRLSPIKTTSSSLGPPIIGYSWPIIQVNWGTQPKTPPPPQHTHTHINSTHHLIHLVAFKPVQSAWKSKSYTCGETDWMVWVDRAGWYRGPIWPLLLQYWIYWWNTFVSNHPRMQHYNKSYQILIFWMWISLSVTVTN